MQKPGTQIALPKEPAMSDPRIAGFGTPRTRSTLHPALRTSAVELPLPILPPSILHLPATALTASDEQFRQLVAGVSEYAIYMLDPEGRVVSWNAGAERVKGYSADEILGQHFSLFFTAEDRASGMPVRELEIAAEDGLFESSAWRVCKDGSRFWAMVTLTAIRNEAGALLGFAKITRNMTAQKKMEEELRALNLRLKEAADELESRVAQRTRELEKSLEELNQKNAEIESFVYIVSHDLRAPLVNLQGFAAELESSYRQLRQLLATPGTGSEAALLQQELLEEEIPESLRFISASVHRFERLIDALLNLSRMGRRIYQPTTVDADALVSGVIASLARQIDEASAKVHFVHLPSIHGDPTALEQVFANLIGNAIKYRSPERTLEIYIEGRRLKDHLHYSIKDNGRGIPTRAMPRLFQIFQRMHPRVAEGEGMGLAIIKRIIERHGGKVWAESCEGAGTTFHFTLPLPQLEGAKTLRKRCAA